MAEEKGIKDIMEILDAAQELAVLGKKIMADGKVNFADIPLFMELLSKFNVLNLAYANANAAVDQVKDLSIEEGHKILAKVGDIAKAIKNA